MYSIKKLTFEQVIDIESDLFSTTTVPAQVLQARNIINSGGTVIVSSGGSSTTIDSAVLLYLTELSDKQATWSNTTTVTVPYAAGLNPVTGVTATKNEFNVYVNGQYIDKAVYAWTPTLTTQSIVFDTSILGYTIEATDTIIVNGRWA